jgi:uncharacterized membrane protein
VSNRNAAQSEDSLAGKIEGNIESIVAIQRRESEERPTSQRRVEQISRIIGQPMYLVGLLIVTILWVAFNLGAPALGWHSFDAFPFPFLDGLLSLAALVSTTVILIAQNRQTRLERKHTHLALQLNLLTEQKVTKLIHLLEELRRDLPMVKDRHDPQSEALKETPDAQKVLLAIREGGLIEGDEDKPPDSGEIS